MAKRAVQVPHSSLGEMRGVLNELTVTDRIGEDDSGNESGERNLSLPLRNCDNEAG